MIMTTTRDKWGRRFVLPVAPRFAQPLTRMRG